MSSMMTLVELLSLFIFQSFVIGLYLKQFFVLSISYPKFYFAIFFIYLVGRMSITLNQVNVISFKYLSLFLTLFIIVHFLTGSLFKKLFHYFFLLFFLVIQEKILALIFRYTVSNQLLFFFIFHLLISLIFLCVILGLRQFKINNLTGLNKVEYIILTITPIISILLSLENFKLSFIQGLLFYSSLFIINIIILVLYNYLSEKSQELSESQLSLKTSNFAAELLEQEEKVATLRHDLKNIISSLAFYADKQDYQNIKKITRDILNQDFLKRKITGCLPIDAVLNQKIDEMKRKNIIYDLDLQVPYNLDLTSFAVDICAILGNILDNAMEEVCRNHLDEPIKIILRFKNEKLVIKVTNPVKNTNLKINYDYMPSSKKAGRYGVGIKSINQRVSKLNGFFNIQLNRERKLFQAMVVIPIRNIR